MGKEKLLINIKVPFCKGKCVHCRENSFGENVGYLQRYRMALEKEIKGAAEELDDYEVAAVNLSCDGLSLFGPGALDDFLRSLKKSLPGESAEWTINLMPGEFSEELLHVISKRQKMDAVHVGLFALEKAELTDLHTPFTANIAAHTVEFLEKHPLEKLSVDLVIGMPSQTMESFDRTLRRVLELKPAQIRLLRYWNKRESAAVQLMYAQETDFAGYIRHAEEVLAEHGMNREGKSLVFALPQGTFTVDSQEALNWDVMGFGIGAGTRIEGLSYRNTGDFTLYVEHSDEPDVIAVI